MNPIENKRVLLVDPNGYYLQFLKRALLSRNYEIAGEAKDSEQAIKLLKSEKPDLILLEFEMPGTNGGEILQQMLTINPNAMVIMLTAKGDVATMQLCLEKGAFHFIRKDYPLETILTVIEESFINFAEMESEMCSL